MPQKSIDALHQLIQSLEKAEKRHFKLYITRSSGKEDLKVVQLFDALDKMPEYSDKALARRMSTVSKPQLANLKAHLYKELLSSLRLLRSTSSVELQMNEQLDYARILYNKGLFQQSLRTLDKARELAWANQKFNFLSQVTSLEKKIETLHISRSMKERVDYLSKEALEVSAHIYDVSRLSNLALRLYSLYIENGHSRNEEEEESVKSFFRKNLPVNILDPGGFYERLYLYQSYTWYAFIRQDFLMYYRYAQKWVDLFHEDERMKKVETAHYIKALHILLNAHFDLRNYKRFDETLELLENFSLTELVQNSDNFRVHSFVYINSARINLHLIKGTFEEGTHLIPAIEEALQNNAPNIDKHRVMVFNYKFAMLYFGSGNFSRSIDYLQEIINQNVDLRYDLQCYARLVHLLAHYEMGNYDIMEYLTRSVYRFMSKMKNLTLVEEAVFRFLRRSFSLSHAQMAESLHKLLSEIKGLEKSRHETRSFAYLDIISWAESKVYRKPMSEIIHQKYLDSRHR